MLQVCLFIFGRAFEYSNIIIVCALCNAPIVIEDGAWIGAQATVCPGVTVHTNAILTVGSIATKDMEENGIYQGNPAVKIRERILTDYK